MASLLLPVSGEPHLSIQDMVKPLWGRCRRQFWGRSRAVRSPAPAPRCSARCGPRGGGPDSDR